MRGTDCQDKCRLRKTNNDDADYKTFDFFKEKKQSTPQKEKNSITFPREELNSFPLYIHVRE